MSNSRIKVQQDLLLKPSSVDGNINFCDHIYQLTNPLNFSIGNNVQIDKITINGNTDLYEIPTKITFNTTIEGGSTNSVTLLPKKYLLSEIISAITTGTGISQKIGYNQFTLEDPTKNLVLSWRDYTNYKLLAELLGLDKEANIGAIRSITISAGEDFPYNFNMDLFSMCDLRLGFLNPNIINPSLQQIPLTIKAAESFRTDIPSLFVSNINANSYLAIANIDPQVIGYIRMRISSSVTDFLPHFLHPLSISILFSYE
jgi:hypothetical protein